MAGAGGAAHLPGMVAAATPLPVVGVPVVPSGARLDGLDALLSIVQVGAPSSTNRLAFTLCPILDHQLSICSGGNAAAGGGLSCGVLRCRGTRR